MHDEIDSIWHIGEIPFVTGEYDNWNNNDRGLPNSLPFTLSYDQDSGRLKQLSSESVRNALKKAYSAGSLISGTMDDSGIGCLYAEDHLTAFLHWIGKNLYGVQVMEIGCGTGYFLSLLRDKNARVCGIEPGVHGQEGAKRYSINICKDFFPCESMPGPFEIIVAKAVLEHIEDPMLFLENIRKKLAENGRLFLSVPDCEPYIKTGDISCLLHEHYSYFDKLTLKSTLELSGFKILQLRKSDFGGVLYCLAQPCKSKKTDRKPFIERRKFAEYRKKAQLNIKRVGDIINKAFTSGDSVGIYVPGRLLNALKLLNLHDNIRFFDDNKLLHAKYYPDFQIPIESFDDLCANSVDELLIPSNTFGLTIAEKVQKHLPDINVRTWDDLFGINV